MDEPSYKLEVFEGPLDLLLSLIAKNKIDICDIPISLILDQYMEYLDRMRELDMDIASEFIVMAAELMLIKSRMLLPKPKNEEGEEEDPREKLARALLEYKKAKEAASYLAGQYETYAGRIVKDTEVFDRKAEIPESIDISLLYNSLNKLLKKNSELPRMARESENAIKSLLKAKVVPVSEKVAYIMRSLYFEDKPFDSLFDTVTSRSELVATFIAVLELVKVQRVRIADRDPDDTESPVILHLDKTHDRSVRHNATEWN